MNNQKKTHGKVEETSSYNRAKRVAFTFVE